MHFCRKNVASRIYAILWAKSLRMSGLVGGGGGRGGHPNLGNAWIFGTFGLVTLVTPPKPILLLLYDRWK